MLFPVKVVREQFPNLDATNQGRMVAEVGAKFSENAIRDFAIDKVGLTKQHTYIFKLGRTFDRNSFVKENLPFTVLSDSRQDVSYAFAGLATLTYNILMTNPTEEAVILCYQPVRVVVRQRILVIQTTIMERKPSSYMAVDKDRRVFETSKTNEEEELIPSILAAFKIQCTVESCDINRGVKALWETDVIDCTSISYKKDKSTATEAMDEQYTLKSHLPEIYRDATSRPLRQTIFKPLRNDEKFSRHFRVDPTKGELSMRIYPEHPDQTWNVINEILANN